MARPDPFAKASSTEKAPEGGFDFDKPANTPVDESDIFATERPQRQNNYPDAVWVNLKNPGDSFQGVVLEISKRITDDYGTKVVYVVRQPNGEVIKYSASIKQSPKGNEYGAGASLERVNGGAEVGDYIGVKFLGYGPDCKPSGREYRNEDVRVRKAN